MMMASLFGGMMYGTIANENEKKEIVEYGKHLSV